VGAIPVLMYFAEVGGGDGLLGSGSAIKIIVSGPMKPLAVPAAAYGKGASQRSHRERDSRHGKGGDAEVATVGARCAGSGCGDFGGEELLVGD
jgi:hypothetical protein